MTRKRALMIWVIFLAGWSLVMALAIGVIVEKSRYATQQVNGQKRSMMKAFYKRLWLESSSFRDKYLRSPKDWGELRAFIRTPSIDRDTESLLNGQDAWGRKMKFVEVSADAKSLELRSAGANGEFGDDDDLVWRDAPEFEVSDR